MVKWLRALRRPELLLLAITVWRLWAAAAIPLTEDEAYYRLWSQHLALGYFDHPPMIAWWIAAGTRILGDTALGVRLLAVLACSATSLLLAQIVRCLGGSQQAASRAMIWYQATLLVGLGGLLATPDAPTTLLWAVVVWLALKAEVGSPRLWLAAGLAAGLALLSKYSSLFLPVGIALWLIVRPEGRRILRTPWPWIAGLLALTLFGLNIAWNATHGWLSFSKQFGRAAVHGFSPKHLVELIVIQALLLNPLIAGFAAKGLARLWRTRQAPLLGLLAPTLIAAPFAAYLVLHS
ncbi:MAG TPA: glycosyltransferase family 39 protein, partial [Caulobacter sp.]|nr:glycosyltransferase family 39 protein [Caulobacter sp.]